MHTQTRDCQTEVLLSGWTCAVKVQNYCRAKRWRRNIFIQVRAAAAPAKSLQSCLTLCDPIDGSPPGSPVPGVLQARTLEWVAISFSNACKWKVKGKSLSRVWLLATLWTAAHQAPPSMGFARQEYWSGVPWPSPCKSEQVVTTLPPTKTKLGRETVQIVSI